MERLHNICRTNCLQCKKYFIKYYEWAYKTKIKTKNKTTRTVYFCSWNCLCKYKKDNPTKLSNTQEF